MQCQLISSFNLAIPGFALGYTTLGSTKGNFLNFKIAIPSAPNHPTNNRRIVCKGLLDQFQKGYPLMMS